MAGATVEALLAQIAANLADDAPRAVLADLLVERGDARGTFIHHQLAGRAEQAHALRRQHLAAWLGPLAAITHPDAWIFERGFPRDASLAMCTPEEAAAQAGHPLFATLEAFRLDGNELPVKLLQHPCMTNVAHLGAIEQVALEQLLVWTTIPYRSLELMFFVDAAVRARLLDARAQLGALRRLTVATLDDVRSCDWIWDSWLGAQLDEIGLDHGASYRDLPAWLAHVRELRPARRVAIRALRRTLVIEHEGDALQVTAHMASGDLGKALAAVPPDLIAHLRLAREATERELGVLANAARRLHATFELVPGAARW